MSKCELNKICEELEIFVRLTTVRKPREDETLAGTIVNHYGNPEYSDHLNTGLYDEHFFINDKSNVTSYCIENYVDVMFIDDCHRIFGKEWQKYKRSSSRYIDAVKLFQLLLKSKDILLEPIYYNEEIMGNQFYENLEEYDPLDYAQQLC